MNELWRVHAARFVNGRILSMRMLATVWRSAVLRSQEELSPKGPIGHAVRQLCWAGWTATASPLALRDREGLVVNLTGTAPRDLARRCKRDVIMTTRERTHEKVRIRLQVDPADWREPWWDLLAQMMQGRRQSPLEKHILCQVIGGTYPCGLQQASWGLETDGSCACGQAVDNVYHRLFKCPGTGEQRRKCIDPKVVRNAERFCGVLTHTPLLPPKYELPEQEPIGRGGPRAFIGGVVVDCKALVLPRPARGG